VTLFLAFAFGTGAVLTGLRVNKASAAQVLTLESDAAKAKRESDEKIAELRAQAEVLRADAEKSRAEIASAQAAVAKASEGMAKLQLEAVNPARACGQCREIPASGTFALLRG
jgi:DNA anti-recombination protein RmuC